jgi:hypothetical protein
MQTAGLMQDSDGFIFRCLAVWHYNALNLSESCVLHIQTETNNTHL